MRIPAEHYTSQSWFEHERERLFARMPVVVGHASELRDPGSVMQTEIAGVSLILVRSQDGELSAFRNACRHRATRLVNCEAPCKRKAFVCPYHGWSYDLKGALVHVPHEHTFGGLDKAKHSLVGATVAEHHGLLWASPQLVSVDDHLASLESDLVSFGLSDQVFFARSTAEPSCNWKLIIDAFLEGYHIRTLHRDSIYPFFLDGHSLADEVGDHIRALTARRALADTRTALPTDWRGLRQVATPSYLLFPNTILVLHPDFTSWVTVEPLGPAKTRYTHTMLVAEQPATDEVREHFQRSFDLIDRSVFRQEDLYIAEQMQRGLETGANEELMFGGLEFPATWFHEALARHL